LDKNTPLSTACSGVSFFALNKQTFLALNCVIFQQPKTFDALNEDIEDYKLAFEATPGTSALIRPDAPIYTILAVTDGYVEASGRSREELINKGIFTSFPNNPGYTDSSGQESLRASFDYVLREKESHQLPVQRYDLKSKAGHFEERYWMTYNKPVKDRQDRVKYIIHSAVEITGKLKADAVLKNVGVAEQTYHLFMQAPVAICILKGIEQVIALANDKMLEIWGKDKSVIGQPVLKGLPELEGTAFPGLLNDVLTTGQPHYSNESHANLVRNGKEELIFFNFVYYPFYEDESGTPVGVMAIASEVTEQVASRKRAEESEQKYRTLITEASVATAVYEGPEMVIHSANEAMIKLWGKDESVIGKTVRQALPELEGQPFHQLLQNVFTTGETYHGKDDKGEIVVDGQLQTFYFNFSYKALRDKEGKIYGILNMAVDVTEQVLTTKKIEEAEERARLAIEASEQGTFEINLLTNELVGSKRMADIFGLSHLSERQKFIDAIYSEDRADREEAYKTAYQTGLLNYDSRIVWADGSLHWVRVKGKTYYDQQGEPVRLVGVVQEITEQKEFAETLRKKVEERTMELQQLNNDLANINKELEQFTYAASHDMQEPLRKVQTFSSILAKHSAAQLDDKGKDYLGKIGTSVARMKRIIDDLLNYSHYIKEAHQFIPTDLDALMKEIEADLELTISQKQATVIKDKLPVVAGISSQMNQLFYNLFTNSLKFSREEIPSVITIKCLEPTSNEILERGLDNTKRYTKILFCDNGIGFEQKYGEYIFSLFKRLHTKTEYEGTGIGLGLCKKIVENHHGSIWATSTLGEGSVFHLLLPL
jgi:PAS domain S-box-containing protein